MGHKAGAQPSIKFLHYFSTLIIPLWCSGITSGCNTQLTGWSPVQLWAKGLFFLENVGEWVLQMEGFSRSVESRGSQCGSPVLFCDGDPGCARLLLGSKDKLREWREIGQVLTSRDAILLAIGSLCNRARGQNVLVARLYLDFAARRTSARRRLNERTRDAGFSVGN